MCERNKEILKFLNSIYIPKMKEDDLKELKSILKVSEFRKIDCGDVNRSFPKCLIIMTKGNGKYTAFAGWRYARIDVGSVADKFAELAIYYEGYPFAYPKRVAKSNIKVSIQR